MSETADSVLPETDHSIRVFAGECTVIYDSDGREEHRGHVTVVVKPDQIKNLLVDLSDSVDTLFQTSNLMKILFITRPNRIIGLNQILITVLDEKACHRYNTNSLQPVSTEKCNKNTDTAGSNFQTITNGP